MNISLDPEETYYFKSRFVDFLQNELQSVYCDTCRSNDDNDCGYCHRKAMEWGISSDEAEYIADKAIEFLESV